MTWGPQWLGNGSVRFRLWGSTDAQIKLAIRGETIAMTRWDDGWHECVVDGVAPGTPYCYLLGNGRRVPDPAARAQAGDVHGPSLVLDPGAYRWHDADWRTRRWEESVYYELHVGAFTPQGTFAAAAQKLGHLADLGITTVEIMPVGQFGGQRGWGYDGVLIYAPHGAYGTPEDMKAFIDAAHGRGLNVVLDVVYNHFGPDGNYLGIYAPAFFDEERRTPWGSAIAYERPAVRAFIIDNALYWLEEFHLDGLRLDAIDQMRDDASDPEIIVEIAQRIRARYPDRNVHLTTEDNRNITRLHRRGPAGEVTLYSGEWNDDFHNVAHVLATGETESYYGDFANQGTAKLARSLAEGFVYQGEPSPFTGYDRRGEPSAFLPPTAFVDFIQNHDQVGNRAFGERLTTLAGPAMVETLLAMLVLCPHIPLLFMGEEWGETNGFAFFTDFRGDLADAVRDGRRREFPGFSAFHGDAASLAEVPDPNALSTFEAGRLDWTHAQTAAGAARLKLTKRLLALRRARIVPLLYGAGGHCGHVEAAADGLVAVLWRLNGGVMHMTANLDDEPRTATLPPGEIIYSSHPEVIAKLGNAIMPARTLVVSILETEKTP